MTNWICSALTFVFLIGSSSDAIRVRRMVGGSDAEIVDFPYLVSLRYLGLHFCGGSIIGEKHVLTAAHCIVDLEPLDEITVHSGTSRSDKDGNVHEIEAVYSHPDWKISENNGYVNDIAVVKLKKPIIFDDYQSVIKLPTCNVKYNESGYVPGWGRLISWSEQRSKKLQKLQVTLMQSEKCQTLMKHKIHPNHVCGFTKKGSGVCFGDSGGPLAPKGELLAIVTFLNEKQCADGVPAGFTNVFPYKKFIEDAMKE